MRGLAILLGLVFVLAAVQHQPPVLATEMIDYPDSDLDGCADAEESDGNDPSLGGQRDPANPWDYFNPTHDGLNRVDDILRVVQQFFKDEGQPGYTQDTDRTHLGPDTWDLGPPNGQQRVDDILYAVRQFFHDCQGATTVSVDQFAPLCDGNLKEATDPTLLILGESYKECRLFRDETGQLVDDGIIDEAIALTDEAYSDQPATADTPPAPSAAGSTIGPRVWQYGCVTGHNRAYSRWGYTLWDLRLKECFAAVIEVGNLYYGVTLEYGKDYGNTSAYPYSMSNFVFDPAWDQYAHWNVYARDFQRERSADLNFRPCCQNWATTTIHTRVRIFWANNRHDYNSAFPSSPGVLGAVSTW